MADETILIIDDNSDTRLLLSLRLKAQGYQTVFSIDVLEAITRHRRRRRAGCGAGKSSRDRGRGLYSKAGGPAHARRDN